MENKLIEIYLLNCHIYDMHKELHLQENRNGQDNLSVPELMAIYLFGQLNGHFKHRHIYDFIKNYWFDCFPSLPSYQAFNRRLNLLEENFHALFSYLLVSIHQTEQDPARDYLVDSMPIMLASGTGAKRARVAREIAATGFSAVKQMNFHGVRLHLPAKKQTARLPLPAELWLRAANVHDLTALKEKSDELPGFINLFADKAYASEAFRIELQANHIELLTPIKKPNKQELSASQKHYSKLISTFRQPIESFFKWLIDKTDIQRASSVRSTEGLLIHCIGKLSFALLLLNFYY